MKNITRLCLPVLIFLSVGYQLFGQCDPDIEGCIDINEPGQICPTILPDAVVNVPYEVVITVLPPDSVELPPFPSFGIEFIIVDTVQNLPEGLIYEASADTFYANSAYCILVSGTPEKAGEYNLDITVTAYLSGPTGIIPAPPRTDSSILITVLETAGLDPNRVNEFHVMPNIPNPFSEYTTLGFYSPFDERIELSVYNILGELMHEEKQGFPPGENYFDFTGESLQPGTYIYRITNSEEVVTGKLIKARR